MKQNTSVQKGNLEPKDTKGKLVGSHKLLLIYIRILFLGAWEPKEYSYTVSDVGQMVFTVKVLFNLI